MKLNLFINKFPAAGDAALLHPGYELANVYTYHHQRYHRILGNFTLNIRFDIRNGVVMKFIICFSTYIHISLR